MVRVLVTGGSGFVGSHVVSTLLARSGVNFEITILRRTASASSDRQMSEWLHEAIGDIEDEASVCAAVQEADPELVIHLAGVYAWWQPDAARFERVNVEGVRNVLTAAKRMVKRPKLLHVSTVLAFGNPEGRGTTVENAFDESTPAGPAASRYAASKHAGDQLADQAFNRGDVEGCTCFLACCIGRDTKLLDAERDVMKMKDLVEGKVPAVIAGENIFTYVDVRDAAEAIVRAGERLLKGCCVNGDKFLVGNQRLKTDEFYALVAELSGVARPTRQVPAWAALCAGHASAFLARFVTGRNPTASADLVRTATNGTLLFDATKSQRELGMEYRNIREAFALAVAFIQGGARELQ